MLNDREIEDVEKAIALNMLAREKMKLRLLLDLAVDAQVCKLEGWPIKPWLEELKALIDSFLEEGEEK